MSFDFKFPDFPPFPKFPEIPKEAFLSRRDRFAAAALQGLLADGKLTMPVIPETAARAVQYADALMQALEKKP